MDLQSQGRLQVESKCILNGVVVKCVILKIKYHIIKVCYYDKCFPSKWDMFLLL